MQDGQDSAPSNPANPVLTGYEIHADGTGGEIPASPDLRTVPVPLREDVVAALRERLTHLCGESQLRPTEQYAGVVAALVSIR